MKGPEDRRGTSGRASRRQFVLPDRLPGETEYGTFITHMTACADCGYGQVQCDLAAEMWQAYKTARSQRR